MDAAMKKFRRDYHRCGKYNLQVQVPHLETLAIHYHQKYRRTKHWTDCLKAHSLYNSISGRRPCDESWKAKAFRLQTEYWGEKASLSFSEQQKITHKLVNELQSIRDRYRKDCATADGLIEVFEGDSVDQCVCEFYDNMRAISLSCSESMRQFANSIISKSVGILNTPPPCHFEAVAIGSVARGEATPYSDLEYLFLVQNKNQDTVKYFEMLAVTTYFMIGNLSETKLSYMAIQELSSWFDDKGKNGFKIDGLTKGAGNIPTGNGSEVMHNHFIVTPKELADRYNEVLKNPNPEESLRGDLTAMLTYTKTLFTHHQGDNTRDLLKEFREGVTSTVVSEARSEANLNMLKTDAQKFNFVPDFELSEKGFNADVKRQFYRFPSILLMDISIVCDCAGRSSWNSLEMLRDLNHIPQNIYRFLKFTLAAATYVRLSTYLHHDSQDDRISLSRKHANSSSSDQQEGKRWFLPSGLFSMVCIHMLPLKRSFGADDFQIVDLKTLKIIVKVWSAKLMFSYFAGRMDQVSSMIKQKYPELSVDPVTIALQLVSSTNFGLHLILKLIAEMLLYCNDYKSALKIYVYWCDICTHYSSKCSIRIKMTQCYIGLRNYQEATDNLTSIQVKDTYMYYWLGAVYAETDKSAAAEKCFVQSLQMEYDDVSQETVTDYYGNQLKPQNDDTKQNVINFAVLTPEERLHVLKETSPRIIIRLLALGDVYNDMGKYKQAEAYYKKSLHSIHTLYGEGAVIERIHYALNNLGYNYLKMGQYDDAEDCFNQVLAIFKQKRGMDTAITLHNLGDVYRESKKDNYTGEFYREALDIYTRLDPGHPNVVKVQGYLSELSG